MGGGSKEATVGYKYYLGMHMVNVHGETDATLRIRVDERDAWTGNIKDGIIYINNPDLFGGESREGGIVGFVDIISGSQTQGANDYLATQLGANVPAFRGVAQLVLRKVYLGINPYLKRWSSLIQRINKKSDGTTQWYPAKAAISSSSLTASSITYTEFENGWTTNDASKFQIIDGRICNTLVNADNNDYWRVNAPPFQITRFYCEFRLINRDLGDPLGVRFDSISGDQLFGFMPQAENLFDPLRRPHINYWGTAVPIYVAELAEGLDHSFEAVINNQAGTFEYWLRQGADLLSTGVAALPSGIPAFITFGRSSNGFPDRTGIAGYSLVTVSGTSAIADMNPAHIIRECLTDKFWGMGYQDADIDDTSFIAAADTLYSETMGISILWDRQTRIEDFIQEIIKHIYATLYVDRITGKFVLKLIRNDYVFASLPQLDETNISKIESYSRPSFGELINSVTVNYHETLSNKTASVTVQDTALVQMQGSVISATVQYPGFSNYSIAARAAQRDLVSLSTPLLTCSLVTDRSVSNLNVGSVFKLYWPDFSDQVIAMRITGMAFGDGRSNKIKITCMEDVFTTPTTVITTPPDSEWTDPSVAPVPCPIEIAMEAPYIEVVQTSGQTTADAALTANPDLGYMLVAASRPPSCINAEVYEDSSSVYLQTFYLDFAPAGKLTALISQMDTSITLKDYTDLDQLVVGQAAKINNEIVKVEAINNNVLTIGRGLFDTTPAIHGVDSKFICYDSFNGSDNIEYSASESFSVKILPISGAGQLPIADAVANTITFDRRAIRPYLPGQIKISGLYYPASVADSPITMTWVHRNRVQQTGSDYLTFLSASVTPEVGTTYSIRLYNNTTGALLHTVDGLTGTSYSGFDAYTGTYTMRLELWTVRSGYSSFQVFSHVFILTDVENLLTEVGATERLLTESGDILTLE